MDQIIPWDDLVEVCAPYYPVGKKNTAHMITLFKQSNLRIVRKIDVKRLMNAPEKQAKALQMTKMIRMKP
jgi:hypothetical protein